MLGRHWVDGEGNEGQGRGEWVKFGETHVDVAGDCEGKREREKRQKQKGLPPPTSRGRYRGVRLTRSDPDPWVFSEFAEVCVLCKVVVSVRRLVTCTVPKHEFYWTSWTYWTYWTYPPASALESDPKA